LNSSPENDIQPTTHFNRLQQPMWTSPEVNIEIDEQAMEIALKIQ